MSATPHAPARAIRIAVLAMGGEGGGVLAGWLIDLAEGNGYVAQMTSVPGVAQRTGATIYYIEMFPQAAIPPGAAPVLAQLPTPGDVDIVLASELMEAGRAIQRGIVTPDRTTLIASTHRVFAMTERIAMADGRVDEAAITSACRTAAQRFIGYDMLALAEREGSVISAAMFGALAASRVLPFDRAAFERTITQGGVGVASSLRAFAAACAGETMEAAAPVAAPAPRLDAAAEGFPAELREIVSAGVAQCRDWQDAAYAQRYLARLHPFVAADHAPYMLAAEVARQLALAMTYEDTIRVADMKIRSSRFARVEQEVGIKPGQILEIHEYLHPRLQEIVETVPAWLRHPIQSLPPLRWLVGRLTRDGKVVETTSIRGFLMLYALAGLRRWRGSNLRDAVEQASIETWLDLVRQTALRDGKLAVELAMLRTLVKGYSDTHQRGYANFNRIVGLVPQLASADTLAKLRMAALADENGAALERALAELGGAAAD